MAAPATTTDGEQKVLATAQQIVKSLHSSTNVSADDVILLFSSIDTRFANLSNLMQTPSSSNQTANPAAAAATGSPSSNQSSPSVVAGCGVGDEDSFNSPSNRTGLDQLEEAEAILHRWESNGEESGIDDYLQVVDHIIQLTEDLSLEQQGEEGDGDVVDRAEDALQLAMARLEDEFRHILIRNVVPFNMERIEGSLLRRSSLSSASTDGIIQEIPDFDACGGSFADPDEEISGRYHRHVAGLSLGGEDLFLDLVNPDAIIDLKGIASRMIRAGYEKECCQVYSSVRRDVLEECMNILEVEKLSIEEVQKMDWKPLDEKMKNWIHALKIVVRILLTSEKLLCEDIFSGADVIEDVCFIEATKGCVMQLLNFGEAVAIGKRSAEKLFRILDMYDALSHVFPDLQELFNDKEAGNMVCTEAQGVLDGLAEAAIGTCEEFENAIKGETSRRPIQNGEWHPLTRYVMNYVKLLVDYSDILNRLLENMEVPESEDAKGKNSDNLESENIRPIAKRIMSILKSLETNLEEKARLYDDGGLQFVFLMNNILYIVQRVKDSELRNLLGDNWIRRRRGQIRQYATSYLRTSWSKVLSFLKDEGIGGSTSKASKEVLKERFKNFNACFEDIYRIQTAWKVPDSQLRDELKMSISERLIPAYRSFLGRFGSHLESGRHAGKYIKYSPEDLEKYLAHLFEGVPQILHHLRRKSS